MSSRKQSSQPTISEKLAAPSSRLTPTVRAGYADSYQHTRPGEVGFDRQAGASMGSLARSLALFDRTLMPVLEQRMDSKIERDVAAGRVRFSENVDENKNRMDWKEAAEKNPELGSFNPYLARGYEEARLESMGLAADKNVKDKFEQSGLKNSTDPQAVAAWTEEAYAKERQSMGLAAYPDKLLMAKHYTQLEARSKANLLSTHSQYVRAQQEDLTAQQYTSLSLEHLRAMTDPVRGGGDVNDPHRRESILGQFSATVALNVQRATENGVSNKKAPEMAANAFFTAYHETKNTAYLDAMKNFPVNGSPLSSYPGITQKVEALKRQNVEEYRADQRWAIYKENQRIQMEQRKIPGVVYTFVQDNPERAPTSQDMDALGISKDNRILFLQNYNKLREATYESYDNSPETRETQASIQLSVAMGLMGPEEVMPYYVAGGSSWKGIYEGAIKNTTDEGKLFNESLSKEMKSVFGLYSRRTGDDLDSAFNELSMMTQGGIPKAKLVDMLGEGAAAALTFYDVYTHLWKAEKQKSGKVDSVRNTELVWQAKDKVNSMIKDSLPSSSGIGSVQAPATIQPPVNTSIIQLEPNN